MASPIEIVLEAIAQKNDLSELNNLLREHTPEKVMKHYDRYMRRKRDSNLAKLMSWALGFREKEESKPFVHIIFAQPVVLDLTNLKQELSPILPSGLPKILHGLYGIPEDIPLYYSPALISMNDIVTYDVEAVAKALTDPPLIPFKVPGFHFRFIIIKTKIFVLNDLELKNPNPFQQLLKMHYKAKQVHVLPPTEVFNMWLVYDILNK